MSDSTIHIPHAAADQTQLDKIVDSLCLLIEMQHERDRKLDESFQAIEHQISAIQNELRGLPLEHAAEEQVESNIADSFRNSVLAEYGLLDDDESDTADDTNDATEEPPLPAAPEDESLETPMSNSDDTDTPSNLASQEDEREIEEIKKCLREKLREAELELSVQRASLSQREAAIEEREARLAKQAKEVSRKIMEMDGSQANTMLGRLKVHLKEFAAARDAKSPDDDTSE